MAQAFRFPAQKIPVVLIHSEGDTEGHRIDAEMPDLVLSDRDQSSIRTMYLVTLTCSTGGLQVVWSLIMSNGTPFLITLGLPESVTAVVWVVAPLCGVFIQPFVGVLSDRCQLPWGRRKPFIVAGTLGCVICMVGLASTKTVIHLMANSLHSDIHGGPTRAVVLLTAILWLLGLNICIQPLQAGIRTLIVDKCPAHQQAHASAWASRITSVGNIVGYLFGFVPTRNILPFLKVTQFSWLCFIASAVLFTTVLITSVFIKESDPRSLPSPSSESLSFLATARYIIWSARTMPRAVRQVCQVQFFAWLGWFPYLFYVSSYVGNLYAAPILARDTHMASSMQARVIEDAVRLGSLASLVFSVFALLTNILIPTLISESATPGADEAKRKRRFGFPISMTRAWSFSHVLFAFCMFSTIVISSEISATVLAALVGISWAFTLWVPYAIIGNSVAGRQERNSKILEGELEPAQQDQAGAIMGLHNCAISAPQIFAALASGCIFWLAPRFGSDDELGWVLRFGGCGSLVAACLAARMDW